MLTPDECNARASQNFPGRIGIVITRVSSAEVASELPVDQSLLAPNGYLHGGSVTALADTTTGFGCMENLPKEATGFTTSN